MLSPVTVQGSSFAPWLLRWPLVRLSGLMDGLLGRARAVLASADGEDGRLCHRLHADPTGHRSGDLPHHGCRRPGLALGHCGHTGITALAHLHVERDTAEVVQVVGLGEALGTPAPEDLGGLDRSVGR